MKVKIHRKDIIDLCNWKHENFGVFAKFLDGLLEDGYLICEGTVTPEQLIPTYDTDHLCGVNCGICNAKVQTNQPNEFYAKHR